VRARTRTITRTHACTHRYTYKLHLVFLIVTTPALSLSLSLALTPLPPSLSLSLFLIFSCLSLSLSLVVSPPPYLSLYPMTPDHSQASARAKISASRACPPCSPPSATMVSPPFPCIPIAPSLSLSNADTCSLTHSHTGMCEPMFFWRWAQACCTSSNPFPPLRLFFPPQKSNTIASRHSRGCPDMCKSVNV